MRWVAVVFLTGCAFKTGAQNDGGVTIDAPGRTDADAMAIDAPGDSGISCLGSGHFMACVPTPDQPYQVTGATNTGIDTDANPPPPECTFVDPGAGPTWCVLAATTITIDANVLFASGRHPLVLFATQTIEIGKGVDVGSHITGQAVGAGADSALCNKGGGAGNDSNGGDGGAGGSFGTTGGNGGAGGGTGNGDTAGAISDATVFRGGCPGDDGGDGDNNTGGQGQHGGGAVLLLAGQSITISGVVNASGAGGGKGTKQKGGGGGGGSGGMIALDAPALMVTGTLIANGGGGAGGASQSTDGKNGLDPDTTKPLQATPGGGGGGGGSTAGAAGAGGSTPAGNSPDATDGAGGGGGGLGVIHVLSGQTIAGTASPQPS